MAYLNGKEVMFSPKVTIIEPTPPPPNNGLVIEELNNYGQITRATIYGSVQSNYLKLSNGSPLLISNITNIRLKNAYYIAPSAFQGMYNLQNLVLEDCPISQIGAYAFEGCRYMQSITLPSTLTTIDSYAFQNCSNIQYLTLTSKPSIGVDAFKGMSNYATLRVPWSSGEVSGAPWGFTGTIVYNYQG